MLANRYRLRRSVDVQRVRREGQRWHHSLVILFALPTQKNVSPADEDGGEYRASDSRFAFAASRRVGTAVARNRAKRVLREAVRAHLNEIEPGWDCLLIAREQTVRASSMEVEAGVRHLLTKAGIVTHSATADRNS